MVIAHLRRALPDALTYAELWLAHQRRATRTPGVQAAVWFDDALVWSWADGSADLDAEVALTTRHRFRVASHSKVVTAIAVMQLVEEGRLGLDDPVARWLPRVADTPHAMVSVQQLLSHQGAVVRDSDDASFWQRSAPFPDVERLRAAMVSTPPVGPREASFKYSNIAFGLLGQVVEAVAGRSWGELVAERIFTPAGMDSSTPDWDPELQDEMATAYSGLVWSETRAPIDQATTGALAAATGVVATAPDLCRLFAALLPGTGTLLEPLSVRRMTRSLGQPSPVDADGGYGLGVSVRRFGSRTLVGHGGGWPGTISRTWADLDDRLVVSVITNAIDGPAGELADGLLRIVDVATTSVRDRVADGDALSDEERVWARGMTGRYAHLWGLRDIAVLGDALWLLDPHTADPVKERARLRVLDADTARIEGGSGYGSPGEQIRVERDADGAIERVWLGGVPAEPLERVEAS